MKKLLALLLAAMLCLTVFAGCGTQNEAAPAASPEAESADTAPVAPETEKKDSVTIGFSSIPSNFDPLNGFSNGVQILYSALVQTDLEMNIVSDLAESYTVSEDALEYSFILKDGLKFSDGTEISPADVVFSFETAAANPSGLDLSAMDSISAEGSTITITLKEPYSPFILTVCNVGIVPAAAYGEDFALKPVSSGPYVLTQYDVDQQFILEANPNYYGGAPGIGRVVFIQSGDEDARMVAVRAGDVDIALTSAAIAGNTSIDGYKLISYDTLDNMGIAGSVRPAEGKTNEDGYPVGNNVTCDIAVRKALAYGIDRQQICDEALYGYATPAYSENDGMPWSNPDCVIPYDLDYAVKLLDDAGWVDSDGDGIREKGDVKASFPLLYFAGDSVRQAVAMSLSNQAREKLGIEILVEGAGEDLSQRMFSEPLMLAWGSSNPMTSYKLFHSSNAGKADWYNPEFYQNETVDGYLDAALHAKTLEEAIPYWQKAQWDGETGTSMLGDAPYIFLLNKTHVYWAREGLNTGEQKIHAHGDAWPLVVNLRDWRWE